MTVVRIGLSTDIRQRKERLKQILDEGVTIPHLNLLALHERNLKDLLAFDKHLAVPETIAGLHPILNAIIPLERRVAIQESKKDNSPDNKPRDYDPLNPKLCLMDVDVANKKAMFLLYTGKFVLPAFARVADKDLKVGGNALKALEEALVTIPLEDASEYIGEIEALLQPIRALIVVCDPTLMHFYSDLQAHVGLSKELRKPKGNKADSALATATRCVDTGLKDLTHFNRVLNEIFDAATQTLEHAPEYWKILGMVAVLDEHEVYKPIVIDSSVLQAALDRYAKISTKMHSASVAELSNLLRKHAKQFCGSFQDVCDKVSSDPGSDFAFGSLAEVSICVEVCNAIDGLFPEYGGEVGLVRSKALLCADLVKKAQDSLILDALAGAEPDLPHIYRSVVWPTSGSMCVI